VAKNLTNALIELMNCGVVSSRPLGIRTLAGNAAWKHLPDAPPKNIRADFSMKAGNRLRAFFGNARKSDSQLRQALEIANSHGLHELVFPESSRYLTGAKDCGASRLCRKRRS